MQAPTDTAEPLSADWREWPLPARQQLLDRLREKYRRPWSESARPEQIPPVGEWFIWLILAGRGWGKTRTGAEWSAEKARRYPGARIALVGQTYADGRDTMVEGESGLLSVLGEHELRGGNRDDAWNRSMGELFLANGSRFKIFSSEKPNRLRGPQHHFAWGDEPATWLDAHLGPDEGTTYANLELGLRLTTDGSEPQVALTGTPKPTRLLTQRDRPPLGLLRRRGVVVTRGHTDENLAHLARTFRENVVEPLRGTRLGRQELAAELLEDVPGALWKRAIIEEHRVIAPPHPGDKGEWAQIPVVGVDPADGTDGGAEHAVAVVAKGLDHDLYVTHSEGFRSTPAEFAREAIHIALKHKGRIVIEKNHGGAWLEEVFRSEMRNMNAMVPMRMVTASQGKRTRAEPVAGLYEQGRVHHVGSFPELEDQQTSFVGTANEVSPDRLDALVWAASEFVGQSFKPAPRPEEGVHRFTDGQVAGVHRFQ